MTYTKDPIRVATGLVCRARERGIPAEIEEAERLLATEKIKARAAKVLATAPPLTESQIATIVAVMRDNGAGRGDAA